MNGYDFKDVDQLYDYSWLCEVYCTRKQ